MGSEICPKMEFAVRKKTQPLWTRIMDKCTGNPTKTKMSKMSYQVILIRMLGYISNPHFPLKHMITNFHEK